MQVPAADDTLSTLSSDSIDGHGLTTGWTRLRSVREALRQANDSATGMIPCYKVFGGIWHCMSTCDGATVCVLELYLPQQQQQQQPQHSTLVSIRSEAENDFGNLKLDESESTKAQWTPQTQAQMVSLQVFNIQTIKFKANTYKSRSSKLMGPSSTIDTITTGVLHLVTDI